MSSVNLIKCSPVGWWFNEGRVADQWSGPFKTAEEAQEIAESLAPDRVEFIKLMQVMPWEKREVKVGRHRYKKCTCKGGFRGERVCRQCEGTGRIEV